MKGIFEMVASNVKGDQTFLAQLSQAWQQLHDEEVADCNQFAQHLDASQQGLIGNTGMTLQQVGTEIQQIAGQSGTQMGGIGTAHSQAAVHLSGGDQSGQQAVASVASLTSH
jgi:phage gpG-like protein